MGDKPQAKIHLTKAVYRKIFSFLNSYFSVINFEIPLNYIKSNQKLLDRTKGNEISARE